MTGAASLAEALRRVLTLAGDHISPDVAAQARAVLARWDHRQRRLAAFVARRSLAELGVGVERRRGRAGFRAGKRKAAP